MTGLDAVALALLTDSSDAGWFNASMAWMSPLDVTLDEHDSAVPFWFMIESHPVAPQQQEGARWRKDESP